jgi:hypothetical protein
MKEKKSDVLLTLLCIQVTDDNIMDLREIGWEGVHWMHLAQARDQWQALVNTVMNL